MKIPPLCFVQHMLHICSQGKKEVLLSYWYTLEQIYPSLKADHRSLLPAGIFFLQIKTFETLVEHYIFNLVDISQLMLNTYSILSWPDCKGIEPFIAGKGHRVHFSSNEMDQSLNLFLA